MGWGALPVRVGAAVASVHAVMLTVLETVESPTLFSAWILNY
jgi:hypothetical protein